MPVDSSLLEILCCPETRVRVTPLDATRLEALNAAIRAGGVRYADGSPVDQPLSEGLITADRQRVYRVDDDIPVMLSDRAIPTAQL